MDLSKIYSLRQKFTIIAITGRTGSGCTEFTSQLEKGFEKNDDVFPKPDEYDENHNSYRKYRIVYNYAKINFKAYKAIYYKHILTAFILKYPFDELVDFLKSDLLKNEFKRSGLIIQPDFNHEIEELEKLKTSFNTLHVDAKTLVNDNKKDHNDLNELYSFFFDPSFVELSNQLSLILSLSSQIKRNKTLQVIANNLRGYGHPYIGKDVDSENIFTIAEVINDLIKAIRNIKNNENTEIVIDSLRNPFEIMFFKQRYSAFYTIAINREDEKRDRELNKRYGSIENEDLKILLEEEHSGGKTYEFYKQNVSFCIQNADIHITFKTKKQATLENKYRIERKENISPIYSWGMQLLKYVSLIDHPGLITPSPEERCMQIAYTAKYNSGCISRQVGAAITDNNFSLKAIGWNNTPEGHVPCSLRSVEDLLNNKDLLAFTPFEKQNKEFRNAIILNYKTQIKKHKKSLKGQNVSYCFKSLINSYKDGKNQVHTRSLHAEESAFLQLSKYGSMGIQEGKLFTTASPCELCSKKAYQLGIKAIYYIDPYPSISKDHILYGGRRNRNPKIRLFNGAIGNAYHWLYEPVMPYKDELSLILEHDIKDIAKQYKEELELLRIENDRLRAENDILKTKN